MRKKLLSKFLVISLVMLCAVGIGGTSVSWMGTTFTIPATGETDWSGPTKVDGFLVSVGSNALSKAGGNFTLTADVNFGGSFGLLAPYFSSRNNPASTGFVRMDNGGSLSWRNAANSADLPLYVTSDNLLAFNGSTILNASGVVPAASGGTGISSYAIGDTLYASGATTLSKKSIGTSGMVLIANTTAPQYEFIQNSYVAPGASIARTKLGVGDPNKVVINGTDGSVSQEAQLAVTRGGTNFGSYSTGDILYASGATTLSKLPVGSNGQQLTLAAGVPSWGSASAALAIASKSANYTITSGDDAIFVNSAGGSLYLTLPSSSANAGKVYYVKKIDNGITAFGIKRAGTDEVWDAASPNTETTLNTVGEGVFLVADGSSIWHVTERRIPSNWTAYTPTWTGFGTVTGNTQSYWRRVGDSIEVMAFVTTGTVAASIASVSLPAGLSLDATKLGSGSSRGQTIGVYFSTFAAGHGAVLAEEAVGTTVVYFGDIASGTNNNSGRNGSTIAGNSEAFSCKFTIPISGWGG